MKLLHIIEVYKDQSTFKTCRKYSIFRSACLWILMALLLTWSLLGIYNNIELVQDIFSDPVSELIGVILKALASVVLLCLILSLAKPY